ncbi:MAG: type I-C CRISPR-associated protein Cas8c/Csd1 [Synergistaceae bacterium]|nr:type I-C CRISPR-associated protein Cas8c/Csd1 [Synergistaceae bacterium]
MGWTNELYKVYELASENPENGLLPILHSTANAQIELVIDEQGNFKGANTVDKKNAVTVIPVTEDSGARSSGIAPMPFADKLVYIAGDYPKYAEGKRADNSKYFSAYMSQLALWKDSGYSHPAVSAVYKYLEKASLMEDLIKSGVLELDPEKGKLLQGVKIAGILQEDSFVRFVVQYNDLMRIPQTWRDSTLYDSFINFYSASMGNSQLCYAKGEVLPVTYKHPSKIRNSGDKAKLISANDSEGFTYRGRFSNKEEAFSISNDFSQKTHNALKWLIQKQGHSFDTLTLVIWASALEELPDEFGGAIESEWDDEETYTSLPNYKSWLQKYIMGFKQDFTNNTKVMVMGLDAATTGRLSIAIYDELRGSEFLNNLEKWHANSAWLRFWKGKNTVCSFSIYEIIRAAYGLEQNERLECKKELEREQILRLLPCIINGTKIPYDLVQTLYNKASNPLAYEKNYNHRNVLEAACGMYRAYKKGDIPVGYDPEETNRSYLYGCLLAIAEKAESDTYDENDKKTRVTNARRYWANFAQRPYQTWQNIEERLRPYLDKHEHRSFIEKQIQDIMDKFTPEAFSDNNRLEPMYLLGYHHYMSRMYTKTKESE